MSFDRIFSQALKDWPEEVDLSIVEHFYSPTEYVVRGLFDLKDATRDKYIGSTEEVIFSEINSAIFIILHRSARDYTVMRGAYLRKEAVKELFEERLKDAMKKGEDLNWEAPDYQIVERYFETEAQKKTKRKPGAAKKPKSRKK